jgi:hypothetical protein
MHSRIEIYWKKIETAPAGVAVQVRVTDGSSNDYLLPYPCKLTQDGWVNAATGSPLAVRPLTGSSTWKPSRGRKGGNASNHLPSLCSD